LELNLEYPKEMALGLKPTIWGTARMWPIILMKQNFKV
jgi:hypothetical protein